MNYFRLSYIFMMFIVLNWNYIKGRNFEPLKSSFYPNSVDMVDTLIHTSEPLLTIKDDGTKIFYYQLLNVATPISGRPAQRIGTIKKNGKEIQYLKYESPYVYYVIAEFPETPGRYYGLYTTSYGDIFNSQETPSNQIHPLGFTSPMIGVMVYPDGSKGKVMGRKPSEASKEKISKPSGTYKLYDFDYFEYIEFTFNNGGTGKIKFVKYPSYENIMAEVGGSVNVKIPGTNRNQRVRNYKGGYTIIKDLIIQGNFKWSISPDSLLTVNLEKTPIIQTPVKIDWSDLDETTVFSKPSDRQTLIAQRTEDMKTNEHVLEAKEKMKKLGEDFWNEYHNFTMVCYHIGSQSIMGLLKDGEHRGIYVLEKNPDKNELDLSLRKGIDYLTKFGSNRKYGVDMLYEDFTKKGKYSIEHDSRFANNDYYVSEINPVERTGKIQFVKDSKKLIYPISFDSNWQLNLPDDQIPSEDKTLEELYEKIYSNNLAILNFEKDKQRKKVVKEYEKKFKNYVMPTQFNTLSDYNDLIKNAKDILELQDYYINYLK